MTRSDDSPLVIIVRAGVAEWSGGDPAPFVLPECGALAAQQRWQDGLVPAVALQTPPANKVSGRELHIPDLRATARVPAAPSPLRGEGWGEAPPLQ